MHGDLDNADLVFTEEDYTNFEKDHGALGAVLQALLITRHLDFVGYSLRDKNFVDLAKEVATTLVLSRAPHTLIGTVLTLTDAPEDSSTPWGDSFQIFSVGDDDPEITNADGRRLEIFLDRVAWRAAEDEWSWILDDRYRHLLAEGKERAFAEALKDLQIPNTAKWNALRELLTNYGLRTPD